MKKLLLAIFFLSIGTLCCAQPIGDVTVGGNNPGGHIIQDEGTKLRQRPYLNFTGAGVTCTDSGGKTVCSITATGTGSSSSVPFGNNNMVQFEAFGLFSGDSVFYYNPTTDTVYLTNLTSTGTVTAGAFSGTTSGEGHISAELGIKIDPNHSTYTTPLITMDSVTFSVDSVKMFVSDPGVFFTSSDDNSSCENHSYSIYADKSEGKFKKCMDGTLTDMDTSSAGLASGDIDTSPELSAILTDEVGTGMFVLQTDPIFKNTFTFEATAGTDYITMDSVNMRFQNNTNLVINSGASHTVGGYVGTVGLDTTVGQVLFVSNDTVTQVLYPRMTRCVPIENMIDTDDNISMGSWGQPVKIDRAWCSCAGTCTTKAVVRLEDGAGNAMTHDTLTCKVSTSDADPVFVSSGNLLNAAELLQFDTTNTPAPTTDDYTVCVEWEWQRQ